MLCSTADDRLGYADYPKSHGVCPTRRGFFSLPEPGEIPVWPASSPSHQSAPTACPNCWPIVSESAKAVDPVIIDVRIHANERAYSGARALRSGMSEILIRPLNGSFNSKIK